MQVQVQDAIGEAQVQNIASTDALSREQWLAERRTCLGGTDIAAVLGIHPYKTAIDVYQEKLGLVEEVEENDYMRFGKILEPLVAQIYEYRTGKKVEQGVFLRHPERSWHGGTPDRLVVGENRGVEIKLVVSPRQLQHWGDEGTDNVPDWYHAQSDWYMALTDRPVWDLIALFVPDIGVQKLMVAAMEGDYRKLADATRIYPIARDEELENFLVASGQEFWFKNILGREIPAADGSERCRSLLLEKFPKDNGKMLPAGADENELARLLYTAQQREEAATREADELRNLFRQRIGDGAGFIGDCWKVTYKNNKDSQKTDWESVAKAAGATADQIKAATVTKPGARVLRFSWNEN